MSHCTTAIVALTVLCVLKRDLILLIPDSLIHENLLQGNLATTFVVYHMNSNNEHHNKNIMGMKTTQDSNKFVPMVEQLTRRQTKVDNHRMKFQVYFDSKNVKLDK